MLKTITKQELLTLRQLMLDNFFFFCSLILGDEFYQHPLHTDLCDFFQKKRQGKLIILARGFLKTTIGAVLYPLWKAVKNPNIRCLITSNTTTNAEKTVHQIRTILETSTFFQSMFPEVIPDFEHTRWSDRCACLKRKDDHPEGTFESAGVGANIIRRHFNLIVEDDTVAPKRDELTQEEAMPSRNDIEQAIGFHKLTVPLLINEEDERIVILTRWASYDLANWIMENENFAVFDRPAIIDGKPTYRRFSLDRLESIRSSMGSSMFSSLFLNSPLAKEFMTFKPDWIRYYEESDLPEDGYGVVTVDPADPPTGNKTQDYSAAVSCWHSKKGIFVRRYIRERLTDKQIIDKTLEMAKKDGAYKIRIEIDRYAHLQFGFREAMANHKQFFQIDPVKTRGKNKEGRIRQRLSPLFENGVIFLKKNMNELEQELFTFPTGIHDDLIDALAWQIEGIYPTETEEIVKKERRRLPNIGEMLDTLRNRGRTKYPFDLQLGKDTFTRLRG